MIALIALYGFVTSRTTIGRQIYAVGGNEKAAKLSGIEPCAGARQAHGRHRDAYQGLGALDR